MRLGDLDAVYKEIDDLRYKLVHEDRENDDLSIGEVNGVIDALTIIRRAGTVDAVPVVRCKDCKYSKPMPCKHNVLCTYCEPYESYSHEPNWFCADGERRESE